MLVESCKEGAGCAEPHGVCVYGRTSVWLKNAPACLPPQHTTCYRGTWGSGFHWRGTPEQEASLKFLFILGTQRSLYNQELFQKKSWFAYNCNCQYVCICWLFWWYSHLKRRFCPSLHAWSKLQAPTILAEGEGDGRRKRETELWCTSTWVEVSWKWGQDTFIGSTLRFKMAIFIMHSLQLHRFVTDSLQNLFLLVHIYIKFFPG